MKKFILSAVAAGALAIGGAASAQDIFGGLGGVLPQILGNIGLGSSSPGYPAYGGSQPAVVAGANQQVYTDQYGRRFYYDQYGRQVMVDQGGYGQPYGYGGRTIHDQYGRQIVLDQYGTYVDQYGRRMQVDAYGRQVPLDQYGSYRDQWGRTVYLGSNRQPIYVEQNGQITAWGGSSYGNYAYGTRADDRDGDGVLNIYDRYPDDSRYR